MRKAKDKLPFQIWRERYDQGYEHILVRERGAQTEFITVIHSNSPIAPSWLRRKQARLNSTYLLDKLGVL